jgi:D-apionolactonase
MTNAARQALWGVPAAVGPFAGAWYANSLRWLAAGDVECIRSIALVVRDRAWRTVLPEPASLRVRKRAGSMHVAARTPIGRAALDWTLHFEPHAAGLDVSASMTAAGTVATNRAGLVVLLPAATFAGARYTAKHVAGGSSRGSLPRDIAPHQPALDLAQLHVSPRDGPTLSLEFAGDAFEIEDQRNWLDPTFKLYSRALSRPIPYRIRDGQRVEQRIGVRIERVAASRAVPRVAPVNGRLPELGVATAEGRVARDPEVRARVGAARPAFVLHCAAGDPGGVTTASSLAASIGAGLRIECLGDAASLVAAIAKANPDVVALHLRGERAQRALQAMLAGTALAKGTFADFVMLNRNGVPDDASRVTLGLCPTVHARDDRSLVETLDTLPNVLAHARRIAGKRALDAGPCSLYRRLLPRNGRPATEPVSRDGVPYDIHPRQGAPLAAAWLASTVAIAAAFGVDSLTAFEASGARGLVGDRESFPPPPGLAPHRCTASHAVFAALAARPGARLVLHGASAFAGVAFGVELDRAELWLVELSGHARRLPDALRLHRLLHLVDRHAGAAWSPVRGQRIAAYGIVRAAVRDLDTRSVRRAAAQWCTRAHA